MLSVQGGVSNYSKNEPKYLYKYCSLNSFALQAIANGHFWYSKLSAFNDPFEPKSPLIKLKTKMLDDQLIASGLIQLDSVELAQINNEYLYERNHHDFTATYKDRSNIEGFPQSFKDKSAETIEKHFTAISNLYDRVENLGVLCLSSNPSSVLMWSHYADDHQGICIQIERDEESELCDVSKTFRVQYSSEYPNFDYFSKIDSVSEESLKQAIIARKGDYWSYEDEWRIIKEEGNRIYESPGRIAGVIFGLRTSFSQKAAIAKMLFGSGIKSYEVRRQEGAYALEVKSMGEAYQST